jgi:L-erythro-3,5-diaminohexanoate dehydrogenase
MTTVSQPDTVSLSFAERCGVHRVVEPQGALPQVAEILDATPERRSQGEMLIDVSTLNIDSASFQQLVDSQRERAVDDSRLAHEVAARIEEIVASRGKMQNPVTGSGGMLVGRVSSPGCVLGSQFAVAPGDRIATLVSLTLTPLHLRRIVRVDLSTHQVDVEGTAVLFPTGALAKMPDDIADPIALALYDIAGAGPQVARLARPGGSVCVLGAGGKSGLVVAAAARDTVGDHGLIVGIETHPAGAAAARRVGHCNHVVQADARQPMSTVESALAYQPQGYDLVVSCVNVPGTEAATILLARERGCVYFFSMATSFSRAALSAEGVSRDIDLMIGNGYCRDHARETLAIYRRHPALQREIAARFAGGGAQ